MNLIALVAFIAPLLVQIVAADDDENHGVQLRGSSTKQQEQQQLEEEGRNLQSHDDPNVIKVIVEYTSEQGKNDAKDKALEITYESNLFSVIGMTIPVKALKPLQSNANIKRIDLDLEVQAILAIEDEEEEEENADDRRELAEEVPWGVKAVQADQVSPGRYAKDIKVCIIDTGYDLEHEDLPRSDTVSGSHSTKYSKKAGNRWNYDGQKKHGTHAAGIIAALGDNDLGVIGILPDASPTSFTLHISKGLDDDGRGSVSGVIEAIEGCIDAGSDIINMSLRVGGGFVGSFNYALRSAYEDHNILLVAAGKTKRRPPACSMCRPCYALILTVGVARLVLKTLAGNDGNSTLSFPASYDSVMSVSAVKNVNKKDPFYTIAPFSQHNSRIEIAAPGNKIKSTSPPINKYKLRSGTSMAAPHVTGVSALLRSYNPRCSAQQIRRVLLASARDLGLSGCDEYFGFGMVQAKAAVDMLKRDGCSAADEFDLLDANGMNDSSLCKPIPYKETCPNGQETLELEVLTDNHPFETSWVLMDTAGVEVTGINGYARAFTRYHKKIAVCKGKSYAFTIRDSHQDGICCGEGIGSYSMWYGNTDVKQNGGQFGKSERTTFAIPLDEQSRSVERANPAAVRINVGSRKDYTDAQRNKWVKDTGYDGGRTHSTTDRISNSDKALIYQSERFAREMTYSIPLPAGSYDVSLHYAKVYFDKAAKRVFNVYMEGALVSKNLDIFKQARSKDTALVLTTTDVAVNDGSLTIELKGVRNNAKLSAIEIHPAGPQPLFINAGGPTFRDSSGNTWVKDDGFYTTGDSEMYSTTANISNTNKQILYQSEWYSPKMTYTIPVINGIKFYVYLHFAEIFPGAFRVGARVFDVRVEGKLVGNNMDIFKQSGKANKAFITSTKGITVNDGSLTIEFVRDGRGNAKISGIEIRPSIVT